MPTPQNIPPDRWLKLKLYLTMVPLLLTIIGASSHDLWALINHQRFGWDYFAYWLVALVATTIFWLGVTWWRYGSRISLSHKLLLLDAGGTFLWYWAFAPVFQYLMLNLSPEQAAVNAFAYFWEVPLVGGLASLMSYLQFRPMSRYMIHGHTDDPVRLYRQAERLPLEVIIRNSIAATLGFGLGATQIYFLVGLSGLEAGKDIAMGFVVSIFVSLYFYLIFYLFIGPVKSRLARQYRIEAVKVSRYHQRVFIMIIMLTVGSLLTMANIYVNNFQKSVRETIISDASRRFDDVVYESQALQSQTARELQFGQKGQVYRLEAGQPLPLKGLSSDTVKAYDTTASGWLQDEGAEPKLIGFKSVGNLKLVTVVYLSDFYSSVFKTLQTLAIAGALLLLVTVGATLIFVRVLSGTLRHLDAGVVRARQTGTYDTVIETGDEFEALSKSVGHFIHETKRHGQQLREEHARLEASLYSLELGMIITDGNGKILNINGSAQRLLLNKGDAPGNISELQSRLPHSLRLAAAIEESLAKSRAVHLNTASFSTKFIDMYVAPISTENKRIIGTITVLQDVTEAQVLQRSRDEFFSIASHELRTPLTAIRGNTRMIQDFYGPVLSKNGDLEEMISDIYDSSARLIDIVNDFLDVSRLEQGKVVFKMTEFNVGHTITAVVGDLQAVLKQKQLTLTVDQKSIEALPDVWADESRTKQVLYNLVGNAAKFTAVGGITISAKAEGSLLRISVTDTGPGIAENMQKLLFHKFQQAGESILTRDASRGTGLGLYISKSIVEAMGGRVELEWSQEGKGSSFGFTLKQATARSSKLKRPDSSEAS